jgi:hypothetical protein
MLRFQASGLRVGKLAEHWGRCKSEATTNHVGPDALVRAGERSSPGLCRPKNCRASPGWAGEGTRPYVVRGGPKTGSHAIICVGCDVISREN